jgi:excisionase family DNA binding protein
MAEAIMPVTFLTVDDLARLCRVTGQTIERWIREDGRLPRPVRVGRRWLFDAEEVKAHLRRLRDD